MEKKELVTTVGNINLEYIEFGEMLIDLFFDIRLIPDDVQEKISNALELAKAEQLRKLKERGNKEQLEWYTKDIKTEIWLHISIGNYGISSWIEADVTDKENDMLWVCASIRADLSESMKEIKPFIILAIMEKLGEIENAKIDLKGRY